MLTTEKFQISPLEKTENVPALEEELEVLIQEDVEHAEETVNDVDDVEQEDDDDEGERSEEDDSKSSEEGIQYT